MPTQVESAWPRFPDYRIDIDPCGAVGQAWQGDVLLAESDRCLVVRETKHVARLYFPEDAVRWELFTATEHHSVCPFKGEADYWSLTGTDTREDNVVWTYRDPFPQVAPIVGHVCFYDERVQVVLAETASDGSVVSRPFSRDVS